MTANVDNMAYVAEVPWHGLGTKLEEGTDLDLWRSKAGLGWDAIPCPLTYQIGEERRTTDKIALLRSDRKTELGIVSDRYNIVQPKEVIEFFRDLVSETGGFTMETAGSLLGGKKIWGLAKARKDVFALAGDDKVERYLLLATSFDLSMETEVIDTSVRVVCCNTLEAARGSYRGMVRVKHINTFDAQAIKNSMNIDPAQWSTFAANAEKLSAKKLSEGASREFLRDVIFPIEGEGNPSEREYGRYGFTQTAYQRFEDRVMDIRLRGPGASLPSSRGTAWGLVNAVTFWADHLGRERIEGSRLNRAWFGDLAGLKSTVYQQAVACLC